MSLGKQAKTLTKPQIDAVLGYLAKTRYPVRDRVIFLLSVKAGLRAKEIASLTWEMVTDAEGALVDVISLTDVASKGSRWAYHSNQQGAEGGACGIEGWR